MIEKRARCSRGFTLVELLIVMSVIGILSSLAIPSYRHAVVKAQEALLTRDLFTMRDLLDQYRADKGKYPLTLKDLVATQYLKAVPMDPFTRSSETWQEIAEKDAGILDVRSGSDLVGQNGQPYNQW